MMPRTSFAYSILHSAGPCLTLYLLHSARKYGTSYGKWYNWYIVYTTILIYNNSILFRACQGFKQTKDIWEFQVRSSRRWSLVIACRRNGTDSPYHYWRAGWSRAL